MKTVNVAQLKENLSSYLGEVVQGEEILIRNRKKPIARITALGMQKSDLEEEILAAEGKLRPSGKRMDARFWKRFRSLPRPDVRSRDAVRAVIADRDEG
jgi:antitoxin (DNA-binding transcriptional repressor) of toxin-antitoxin stability system